MTKTQIQIISTPAEVQAWVEASVSSAFEKLSLNSIQLLPVVNTKPITASELCRYLNISLPSLIRWRKKGRVPFLQIGGSIRYDRAAVVAALESKRGAKG
jgi:excisionase family DNA binding protein